MAAKEENRIEQEMPDFSEQHSGASNMRAYAESIGDIWVALTGHDPGAIMPQVVATVIEAGGTRPVWQWKRQEKNYILLAWPQEQPIRAAVLLSGRENEKLMPLSVFPLLEGLPNDLIVEDVHPRQEGHGADVAVEMYEGKNPMWFFDPFYERDRDDLTLGVMHTFWLSGAALAVRKALLDHVTLAQGYHYEEYARQWLEENPGKKPVDVPPLRLEIKDKHMIVPGRHFGEYQVRAVIEDVEDCQFEKMPVKILYLKFPFENRPPLLLAVYASGFVLGDYVPEKGQEIEAYIWLQGRIIDPDTESGRKES